MLPPLISYDLERSRNTENLKKTKQHELQQAADKESRMLGIYPLFWERLLKLQLPERLEE